MNQSDSEGSSQGDNNSKHIERLHAVWKNIKEVKKQDKSKQFDRQSGKQSLGSVKQAIHNQQQKNLQTRLAMTQKQLSKSRENTALLMKKLSQAEQQIQYISLQWEKQKRQKQQCLNQIDKLRYQMGKTQKDQTFGKNKQINHSIHQELQPLKKKLQLKDKDIDRLVLKIKSLELDNRNQDIQIKNLLELNDTYKRQLSDAENAMNQIYLGEDSKGAQLLELDEANKNIQRLIQLLKMTQQYQHLGNFAEDAKGIHFLKNIPKRLKTNMLNHQVPQKRKMCSCMQIKIDQKLLWTSASCYKTMLDMKMKYQSLNEDCIQQVLFQLNKIWLAREQAHVRRVKQSYQNQLNRLKKKGQLRYDQMVARKQIQRLKKQLNGAKYSKKSTSAYGNLDSLKTLGQYEDQLRLKQKQIKLLQQRIKLIQTQTNANDKVFYMEGALWIIDKVITQMETNEEDLRQFQLRFRQKMEQNVSHQDWIRSYKQFFQNITQIQNVLIEKLFMMKQSTLKKIGTQKSTGKDSILLDLNRRY